MKVHLEHMLYTANWSKHLETVAASPLLMKDRSLLSAIEDRLGAAELPEDLPTRQAPLLFRGFGMLPADHSGEVIAAWRPILNVCELADVGGDLGNEVEVLWGISLTCQHGRCTRLRVENCAESGPVEVDLAMHLRLNRGPRGGHANGQTCSVGRWQADLDGEWAPIAPGIAPHPQAPGFGTKSHATVNPIQLKAMGRLAVDGTAAPPLVECRGPTG
ncbi:MAG TPA: hypothetical protein QGF58_17975, partial [Myxococcota bacterium]|nr:hypothetical protein [Myxococcota bacterium]